MDNKIVFNNELLKIMGLFAKITNTMPKDCFYDANELLNFVVPKGEIRQAVGKMGANVKRIEQLLQKKIKIIEYDDNIEGFIRNIIMPIKVRSIQVDDINDEKTITIEPEDLKTRGLLIGRNAKNLRNYESIINKYYKIKELKVM